MGRTGSKNGVWHYDHLSVCKIAMLINDYSTCGSYLLMEYTLKYPLFCEVK